MLKIKKVQFVNKKFKAFSLLEVLIIIALVSIFLSSIMFSQSNILKNKKNYADNIKLLQEAKNYIYECQSKNTIISTTDSISISKIHSKNNVETYKYKAEKGGSIIEIKFSITKK